MTARAGGGSTALDGAWIRRARTVLIGHDDLSGRDLARRLSDQMDGWFDTASADLPAGWALIATGGYAAGMLCPASDIDVVLVHPQRVDEATVRSVAEQLWYPIWDAGVKLSPSAHTTRSLLALAAGDLTTATTTLRIRHLGGERTIATELRVAAREQWRKRSLHWLRELWQVTEERWERLGDVASLLEPDLKDGKGGYRDYDAIRWALATERADVLAALEAPVDDLVGPAETLLSVRCELHRRTGSARNKLLLQDQDAVAAAMGFSDADLLMLRVASAARAIDWASERFWRRVDHIVRSNGRTSPSPRKVSTTLQPGITVVDDEVHVDVDRAGTDQSLILRVAEAAARSEYPISKRALLALSGTVAGDTGPWNERTRQAFIGLLGSGPGLIDAVEALERYELFSSLIPDWRRVRSLPQRNAFHRYTVDRHLLQTAANACDYLREVSRPDLLLAGAFLHDIGKGCPGDHTDAGLAIIDGLLPRMGFSDADADVIASLVRHHLLLAETATRRDLSDPRTAERVAELIGDPSRLALLRALTEADSLATGPSAWSSWKARLIDELVHLVSEVFAGRPRQDSPAPVDDRYPELLDAVRSGTEPIHIRHELIDEFELWTVAAPDRRGLFAAVAGTFSIHGIDIVSAEAWTSSDGVAVDQIRALPTPAPRQVSKIEADLRAAVQDQLDLAGRVSRSRGRARHRRLQAAAAPRLEVLISNDASQTTTVVEVRAPDDFAVLYRLAAALNAAGLDIRAARVATLGHEVVDVFYVNRTNGDVPQVPDELHDDLEARLRAALAS